MRTASTDRSTRPTSTEATKRSVPLPLVVHLGFAGSRTLLVPKESPGIDGAVFDAAVERLLAERFRRLPAELRFSERHFLCGISQMAAGADMVFSRVCRATGIMQRVLLPQHRDEYLEAIGSNGPDFTAEQKREAEDLLGSPHVIQERVVSGAATRRERFEDVNLEIVRLSDIIVCLLRDSADGRPGGTGDLMDMAGNWGRPVLELRLAVRDGAPEFVEQWHRPFDPSGPPALPARIEGATLESPSADPPPVAEYCSVLKRLASSQANWKRRLFKVAALVIIGAHVLATVCAVIALKVHGAPAIPWLLAGELVLLALGFGVHQYLHRSHSCEIWSLSRLVAEVARSVAAIGRFHVYLEHLFTLPFPPSLRPLLRTVSVLHLRSTRAAQAEDWKPKRDAYIDDRLLVDEAKKIGQVPYHRGTLTHARSGLRRLRWTFVACSLLAFAATLAKLLTVCGYFAVREPAGDILTIVMGAFAIVLPVLAVAALSLATAFDLVARVHTSEEMLLFLDTQIDLLRRATSSREYARLLLETEYRLLGETANWYARRSFTGVA